MSTILITGGTGYIGSHVAKELITAGHKVILFDTNEMGHAEVLTYLPGAQLVVGDIADSDLIIKTVKENSVTAVIHLAAYTLVGESVEDPAKYYLNNTAKAVQFLEVIRSTGIDKLIFSSTAAVYGEPQYSPIDEQHPFSPTNPYGQTKLIFEKILQDYERAYGLRSISLRFFCAAGADPDGDLGEDQTPETHLIPLTIFTALGYRPSLTVHGTDYPTPDGTAVRDFIHVNDLARAHVLALNALENGAKSTAYNLGTGKGYSVREIIETTQKITNSQFKVVDSTRRPGDPVQLVASSDRIQRELGWEPKYSDLETIIRTAYTWFSTHPKGYSGNSK